MYQVIWKIVEIHDDKIEATHKSSRKIIFILPNKLTLNTYIK